MTKRLILVVLLAGSTAVTSLPARADPNAQVVAITASKFKFTPNHIVLTKGQPVTLQLTSNDREHGFLLRAFKIDTVIPSGATTAIKFTPQTAGTFQAICDDYCGWGHGDMRMSVEVRDQTVASNQR
jgi:cytochrome c oxidase subunit 2